jgi:ATP-binding cassette, subfamily B, bacterial
MSLLPRRTAVWDLVRRLPGISMRLAVALAVLLGAQVAGAAVIPLALGRLIEVLPGLSAGAIGDQVVLALATVAVVLFLDVVLGPVRTLVASRLAAEVDAELAQLTVEGCLRPQRIDHLDDQVVADRIERSRAVGLAGFPPGQVVTTLANLVPLRLAGLTSAGLLGWSAGWWTPLLLGAAWMMIAHWHGRELQRVIDAHAGDTTALRQAAYLRDLAIGAAAAKEVRVFGLPTWLVAQFTRAWWDAMVQLRQATTSWRWHAAGIAVLATSHLIVLMPLTQLSIGHLTVALQAVLGMAALGSGGDQLWQLHMASAAVPAALAVGALDTTPRKVGYLRPAGQTPRREIRFEGVTFGYPGDPRPVLDGLDLAIPAGSSLALVGANGAGKSTITKLLAGLYQPDGGRITVDGHPLDEYDLAGWRRQLAVMFQDFLRYPGTVRDNIGFGRIDIAATDEAVAAAARLGGFTDVQAEMASGWDTPLGGEYTGGTELSGGQWQRLALSRALYAVRNGARVLVLDEPTAHLDVMAEHDLYARLLQITTGITTILVSHRFATVRLADRIAVVHQGRITEYGTHADLVAAGGRYARLFAVQSEPFMTFRRNRP